MGQMICWCCQDDVCNAKGVPASQKYNEASLIVCRECAGTVCGECCSKLTDKKCGLCNTSLDSRLVFESDPVAAGLFALGQTFRYDDRDCARKEAIEKVRALGSRYATTNFTEFVGLEETVNSPAGYRLWAELVGDANTTPIADRPTNNTLFELAMERNKRKREDDQKGAAEKRAKVAAARAVEAVARDEMTPAQKHAANIAKLARPSRFPRSKCGNSGNNAALDAPMKRDTAKLAHYVMKDEGIVKVGEKKWVCAACASFMLSHEEAEKLAN